MPASPTESTSGSARDRAATEAAATQTATTEASLPAAAIVLDSPAAVKGAVSPASPTGSSGKAVTGGLQCPQCGGSLDRYEGDNIHKLRSAFCQACGVRHHNHAEPASVPAASSPAG